jgi:hypothetical protein
MNVLVISLVFGFMVSVFLEYPFRLLSKILLLPQKRIIKLKSELARELYDGMDHIFND